MDWSKIVLALAFAVMCWFAYKNLRANPETLSKDKVSKSFTTMGVLALGLIVFIGFCVMLLRS